MEHSADELAPILQFTTTEAVDGDFATPRWFLSIAGELDIAGASELEERIQALVLSGATVELDISGLTFIDSTGLSVLVRRSLAAAQDGGSFRISRNELSDQVRRLIETTGTAEVLWP
jgi:anti-sigma B factor antagonist